MNKCEICKNADDNTIHLAKEMMFGLDDVFQYLECSNCKCLQLLDIPSSFEKYYPSNYYSYSGEGEGYLLDQSVTARIKKYLKKSLTKHVNFKFNLLGAFLSLFVKNGFPWLIKNTLTFDSKILDVGCGAGYLLLNMRYNGFKNLTGTDPFVAEQINYKSGVTIYKKDIFNINEKQDVIMMHHSFEHMGDPKGVLEKIYSLLNPKGYLLISIPVADSFAWKKYGVNWVQLDAPRHLFLHTEKSMKILAKESGFNMLDVRYISTEFQFTGSELYMSGQNLNNGSLPFSKQQIQNFKKEARLLDKNKQGDTAIFYLQKI